MEKFTIVQVGDIHFSPNSAAPTADVKLPIPNDAVARLAQPPLEVSARYLYKVLQDWDVDLIAFMGDLTDRGDKVQYGKCLRYLEKVLDGLEVPAVLVQGNHDCELVADDFDAEEIDTSFVSSISRKTAAFERIAGDHSSWLTASFGECYVEDRFEFQKGVVCVLANTASGSIDTLLAKKLSHELSQRHATDAPDMFEFIDLPYFGSGFLGFVDTCITETEKAYVFVGHHGLNPQRTPRLALYPEVVNAGQVKAKLKSLPGTTIYLHGHTHEFALDQETDGLEGGGKKLICVSAPSAESGFNIVEVLRSDRTVIGVNVIKIDSTRQTFEKKEIFVPTVEGPIQDFLDEHYKRILTMVGSEGWRSSELNYKYQKELDNLVAAKLISVEKRGNQRSSWRYS